MKGKHHTEATKKTLSEKMTGKNHPRWGKHHSDATKKKMRLAQLGKTKSKATRQKMSDTHKGIAFTREHILNLEKAQQKRREKEKDD